MNVMKKGLVMEGGAMRGMFTCGVTDVFMEHGIVFDGAIGVSACIYRWLYGVFGLFLVYCLCLNRKRY